MSAPGEVPYYAIGPGNGGLPRLNLRAADGSRADVYLQGATVVSWHPIAGGERLFLSRAARFAPGEAIRGGVPVIFPQFGALGPLRQHGFARRLPWEAVSAESTGERTTAVLRLQDSAETQHDWPHRFLAELTVTLGGPTLRIALAVTNTGDEAFSFTAALHTYLGAIDLAAAHVEGLAGLRYRDQAAGGTEAVQEAPLVDFTGEVDRIYFGTPPELRLVGAAHTTVIQSTGFSDAVVWNPGPEKAAAMADLAADEYRRFVCVEAAAAGSPVVLAPGETWQGTQTLAT